MTRHGRKRLYLNVGILRFTWGCVICFLAARLLFLRGSIRPMKVEFADLSVRTRGMLSYLRQTHEPFLALTV